MTISRPHLLALAAGAFVPLGAAEAEAGASEATLDHAVIFRFPARHVAKAVAAFRALERATRAEAGNVDYTVFQSTEDDVTFVIFERWRSAAALAAHEKTEAFLHYGRGTLERLATTHEAVTCRPLDAGP